MMMFVAMDDDDPNDVFILANANGDDGQTCGDVRLTLSPGHTFQGVPYEVFRNAAPGSYQLEELQNRAKALKKDRVA